MATHVKSSVKCFSGEDVDNQDSSVDKTYVEKVSTLWMFAVAQYM